MSVIEQQVSDTMAATRARIASQRPSYADRYQELRNAGVDRMSALLTIRDEREASR